MWAKTLNDIKEERLTFFNGNIEAMEGADRKYRVEHLEKNIEALLSDIDSKNEELAKVVNKTADMLVKSRKKDTVLNILSEYNQTLFEYVDVVTNLYDQLIKDQRSVAELKEDQG